MGGKCRTAGEKGGRWELALELLNECKTWSTPDTISYSAAISACEKGGRWELALELLNECKTWSTPNTISYSAAISACEKGGAPVPVLNNMASSLQYSLGTWGKIEPIAPLLVLLRS